VAVSWWDEHLVSAPGEDGHNISYVLALQQVDGLPLQHLVQLRVCDCPTSGRRVVVSGGLDIFASQHFWRDYGDVVAQALLDKPFPVRAADV